MIENIVTLLASDEWLIGDEDIDIAKGKIRITGNLERILDK